MLSSKVVKRLCRGRYANIAFMNFSRAKHAEGRIMLIILVAAVIVVAVFLFKDWDNVVNNQIDGGIVTVRGSFTCLPLKDPAIGDPNKCALGLKSGNDYYALDTSRVQDANTDLKADDYIAATGTMRPKSDVPVTDWALYDVEGIIIVNTLLRTR